MSLLHQFIIASLAAVVASQCPGNFFESGGSCFSVIDMPGMNVTWNECRTACQVLEGGVLATDLATFDNAEELEAFSITWIDESNNYSDYPYMWIGVEKVDDAWQTVNGLPVSLQNLMWHTGHPHDMGLKVFLEDISMTTGTNSYGRLYYSCTMGTFDFHSRCLCRAK